MPIEVDATQRLDEIAAATIEVARERGVRAVTIRAVAERLGGSTAMVTNYVASRADLMSNALRRAEREWAREVEEMLAGVRGADRLPALARWMCTTADDDEVMRRLLLEIVGAGQAGPGPGPGPAAAAGPNLGPGTAAGSARSPDDRPRTGRDVERVRAVARSQHGELAGTVAEAGIASPALAADILHLLFRGYWLSTLEDPEAWPAERGTRTALAVIDLLLDKPRSGPDSER